VFPDSIPVDTGDQTPKCSNLDIPTTVNVVDHTAFGVVFSRGDRNEVTSTDSDLIANLNLAESSLDRFHRFSPSQGFVSVVRVSTKGSIGDSLEEVKDIIVDFRNFPKIVENTLV